MTVKKGMTAWKVAWLQLRQFFRPFKVFGVWMIRTITTCHCSTLVQFHPGVPARARLKFLNLMDDAEGDLYDGCAASSGGYKGLQGRGSLVSNARPTTATQKYRNYRHRLVFLDAA